MQGVEALSILDMKWRMVLDGCGAPLLCIGGVGAALAHVGDSFYFCKNKSG